MALIKCLKCGEEISDKARKCPYCGNKTKNKRMVIFLFFFIVVLLAIIGMIIGINTKKKEERRRYVAEYNECVQKFDDIRRKADNSIISADYIQSMTASVWVDAIFKQVNYDTLKYTYKNDTWQSFTQALNNLNNDTAFQSKKIDLKKTRNDVTQLLNDIENVPEELQDTYSCAKEFVNIYSDRVDYVIEPNGSYLEYQNIYIEKKSSYSRAISTFRSKIPEKIEE